MHALLGLCSVTRAHLHPRQGLDSKVKQIPFVLHGGAKWVGVYEPNQARTLAMALPWPSAFLSPLMPCNVQGAEQPKEVGFRCLPAPPEASAAHLPDGMSFSTAPPHLSALLQPILQAGGGGREPWRMCNFFRKPQVLPSVPRPSQWVVLPPELKETSLAWQLAKGLCFFT